MNLPRALVEGDAMTEDRRNRLRDFQEREAREAAARMTLVVWLVALVAAALILTVPWWGPVLDQLAP